MRKTIITLLIALLTALANAQEVNYTVTPSNEGTVEYTDFAEFTITFTDAATVQLNDAGYFMIDNTYGISTRWDTQEFPEMFAVEGNKVTVRISEDDLEETFAETGQYKVGFADGFLIVDEASQGRIEITYNVTVSDRQSIDMIFNSATDANGKLWFYLPEGYTWMTYTTATWDMYGQDGQKVGQASFDEDESDDSGRTFFIKTSFTSESDKQYGEKYHVSIPEGIIKMRHVGEWVAYPSAAKELDFTLSDPTAINNINATDGRTVMYDLSGRAVRSNSHGIKILRDASGKTIKVLK